MKLSSPTRHSRILGCLALLTFGAIATTHHPAQAADRIQMELGPIKLGVSLSELEAYTRQAPLGKESNPLLARIEESDRPYVQQFLSLRSDFKAQEVSQFFSSRVGQKILYYLGDFIQIVDPADPETPRKLNGAKAILNGLALAAADQDGLSLLNFVRKYPHETIYLNLEKGFEVANKIEKLGKETISAIAGIEKMSLAIAQAEPKIDPQIMASLAGVGPYSVKLQTENLTDLQRQRQLTADFYLPQGLTQPAPVVVFSHGLGADRQHFASTAKHLASHGFVAVTLEHPGSNTTKLQQLLQGLTKEIFDVSEFIDRPQDVSYILDDLAQRFPGAVNVQQAGVIGHSFGGYTALALAGATIDFQHLTQECRDEINSINVSLLLQCEALKLSRQPYNFRDRRIQFALAINPVDSSIFGPTGMAKIKIPVAIIGASGDAVAPLISEQIRPFSWLVAPQRYLIVIKGAGHVTNLQSLARAVLPAMDSFIPKENVDPLQDYLHTMTLALVQTHVGNQTRYLPYLQAGYAMSIHQNANRVNILRSITPQQFKTLLE
jgi:predicted dienelactone hydrolase